MAKRHLKTLTAPTSWPIKRKGQKFVLRPNPGKSFDLSIPLALVFKILLKKAKTLKEVKTILRENDVLVDGTRRKNVKYLLGFMDVLSLPVLKENYRMLLNKNKKLFLLPIDDKESKFKICKIVGKKVLKKGKVQINLFDGRNILVKEDKFKVGDSVVLEVPSQKIKSILELKKGNYVFLTGGKHTGEHGVIEELPDKGLVTVKSKEEQFETPREFIFVIGKDKPEISLEK